MIATHEEIHQELHVKLDELVADFIRHNQMVRLSETSIIELMEWSYGQTQKATEVKLD